MKYAWFNWESCFMKHGIPRSSYSKGLFKPTARWCTFAVPAFSAVLPADSQSRRLFPNFPWLQDFSVKISPASCTAETWRSGGHLLKKKRPIKWTELRALLIYSKAFYNTVVRHIFGGVWYVVKYWCIIGKKNKKTWEWNQSWNLNDAQNKPHRCVPMCCLPQSPLRVTH